MDEVIPGLWIGDISAAVAQHALEQNNIKFVLSAMRGRVKVNPVSSNSVVPRCTDC
jgi:dual specificity phosphatase 12